MTGSATRMTWPPSALAPITTAFIRTNGATPHVSANGPPSTSPW